MIWVIKKIGQELYWTEKVWINTIFLAKWFYDRAEAEAEADHNGGEAKNLL